MKKNIILLLFIVLLLLPIYSFAQDKLEIKNLLYEITDRRIRGEEIILLEEFNFGIDGGINLLVEWYGHNYRNTGKNNRRLIIYVLDVENREIKFEYQLLMLDGNWPPLFSSWYLGISGIIIDSDLCQIADFNGDGFDEILLFIESDTGNRLEIQGYESESNRFELYCEIPILITRQNNQPSPVEFLNYKGKYGFKALSPNNKWFFYTWDETQRKYIEVEEVDPRYIGEEGARLYQRESEELNKNEIEQVVDSETTLENELPQTSKDSQFPLWLFIGGGLVLLAAVGVGVAVIVKKRR